MSDHKISVLVTGAAGYMGTRLTQLLAHHPAGYNVVATDIREVPQDQRREGVIYAVADVRGEEIRQLLRENNVQTVVHLACIVTPGPNATREFMYSVDVDGTENVMQACLDTGVKRIVVTSSGAAYGYHEDNPEWLTEEDPVRGNPEFPYSDHKRIVEENMAVWREKHPELEQVILRVGTILGQPVKNQITNLFEKPRLFAIKGSASPFVVIWDEDLAEVLRLSIQEGPAGIYNVAGDGALSIDEIGALLAKPVVKLPAWLVKTALAVAKPLGISRYGPEQVRFLQYRPVLANDKLKSEFGYIPQKTSHAAFVEWMKNAGHI